MNLTELLMFLFHFFCIFTNVIIPVFPLIVLKPLFSYESGKFVLEGGTHDLPK